MKKGILLILSLLIVFSFSACGKSKDIQVVEEAINQIGEITLDSQEAIERALGLYNMLTDDEKTEVENRFLLSEAQEKLKKLKEEKEKEETEKAAAEEARKEQEAKEKKEQIKAMITTLNINMLYYCADLEKIGNLTMSVWINAINETHSEDTDAFTCPDGTFVDDFNEALENLFSDSTYSSDVSLAKENQKQVMKDFLSIEENPLGLEKEYKALKEQYDAYLTLCNHIVNLNSRSESYNTFSANFGEYDTNAVEKYDTLKALIDLW